MESLKPPTFLIRKHCSDAVVLAANMMWCVTPAMNFCVLANWPAKHSDTLSVTLPRFDIEDRGSLMLLQLVRP